MLLRLNGRAMHQAYGIEFCNCTAPAWRTACSLYTLTMSKFWRMALAWLLVAALPIQGYAAQTMLLCGPANHQSSVIGSLAGHGHDHARMADATTGGHAMAGMDVTAHDDDKAAPAKAKHTGKCSVCSTCCNVVAITTQFMSFAVVAPDLPEVPTVKAAHDRIMVGGLERPPRLSRL